MTVASFHFVHDGCFCLFVTLKLFICFNWQGCNLIFSGTSGPPITSVPNQNSELVCKLGPYDLEVLFKSSI